MANKEGRWTYVHEQAIKEGKYHLWAVITDKQGSQSLPSEKFSFIVASPSALRIFSRASLVVISLGLIIIVMIIFVISRQKRLYENKKNIRQKTALMDKNISRVFIALKQEVEERVTEEKAGKKVNEALEISEKFIKKELKDIENKLK